MTGRLWMIRALSILAFVAPLVLACGRGPATRIDRPEAVLPPDADLVVIVSNLESLHRDLDVAELTRLHASVMHRVGGSLREQLGFDPTDVDAARRAGLDPTRPLGLAVLQEPRGATVAVLPGNGSTLADSMRATLRGEPETESTHRGVTIRSYSRSNRSLIVLDDHLVVVSGILRSDARAERCRRLLDDAGAGAIGEDPTYRKATADLPAERDVVVYQAPGAGSGGESRPIWWSALGLDRAHDGMAATIDVMQSGLRFDQRTYPAGGVPPDIAAAHPATRKSLEGVPSSPFALALANVNAARWWRWLRESTADSTGRSLYDGVAEELSATLGVNVETEILPRIDRESGLLVNRVALMGSDLVAFVGIDDPGEVVALLDRIIAHLRERPIRILGTSTDRITTGESGPVTFYQLRIFPVADVCIGVVDDRVIVTSTVDRFRAIVAGGPGFLESIRDPDIVEEIGAGRLGLVHIDLATLSRQLGGLPIPGLDMAVARDLLGAFDRLTVSTDIEEAVYRTRWRLQGAGPDLWPRLLDQLVVAAPGEERSPGQRSSPGQRQ